MAIFALLSITASQSFAQKTTHKAGMKDCCMMKEGKMMCVKHGKEMPMTMDMTMKNGTKCSTSGECTMKNGKKMMMKNGECMDKSGKISNCGMHTSSMKTTKTEGMDTYVCSMHSDVTSDKPGKCSKCGMELVKKN